MRLTGPPWAVASLCLGWVFFLARFCFSAAAAASSSRQDVINALCCVSRLVVAVVVSHGVLQIYDLARSLALCVSAQLSRIYTDFAHTYWSDKTSQSSAGSQNPRLPPADLSTSFKNV